MQVSIQRISITHLREVTLTATWSSAVNQIGLHYHYFQCKGSKKRNNTESINSKHISSALFRDLTSLWHFFNLASHFNVLVLKKRALKWKNVMLCSFAIWWSGLENILSPLNPQFGSIGQECNWQLPKLKPCICFFVQVHYNFVLQKASLTCQGQQGRCTNFFSQLRNIMKASINICNHSQGLGQCLK